MDAFRSAIRRWTRRPGLAVTITLTLGFGVGAATTLYSVANAVLFRGLPWPDAERLVTVSGVPVLHDGGLPASAANAQLAWPDWRDLRSLGAFQEVAVWHPTFWAFGERRAEIVPIMFASSSFLSLLGARPVAGRLFMPDEDTEAGDVVVMSFETWQRRFGGRPDVVGEGVRLGHPSPNGRQMVCTVIGVLPKSFQFEGEAPEFILPSGAFPIFWRDSGRHNLRVLAKLKAGIAPEAAAKAVDSVLAEAEPDRPRSARVTALHAERAHRARIPLLLLSAGSALLLLVACASVAGLLLGEGRARRHDTAVRMALGAGKTAIRRQLLVDHLALGLAGGAVGLVLTAWLKPVLFAGLARHLPGLQPERLDPSVVAFALILAVVAAIGAGTAPSMMLAATPPLTMLSGGDRGSAGWRDLPQRAIVVSEVALALVLVVVASLLGETLFRLTTVPLGFEPRNLASISIAVTRPTDLSWSTDSSSPTDAGAGNRQGLEALATRLALEGRDLHTRGLLDRLVTVPGVRSAAGASVAPFGGVTPDEVDLQVEGHPPAEVYRSMRLMVTDSYFRTIGLAVLRGRAFEVADAWQGVVLVSAEFERAFLDGKGVGRRFSVMGASLPHTVIGVVSDVRAGRLYEEARPTFYRLNGMVSHLLVRTRGDAAPLLPAIRRAIADYDSRTVVTSATTVEQQLAQSLAEERLRAMLSSVLGGTALVLAAVGLYALSARRVLDRRRELALRVALGASQRNIRRLVFGDVAATVGLGVLAGAPLASAAGHLLRAHLFGVLAVSPRDFMLAAAVIGVAAFIATVGPAYRACRVDPMRVLRD
jgi:hypothetical protein